MAENILGIGNELTGDRGAIVVNNGEFIRWQRQISVSNQ